MIEAGGRVPLEVAGSGQNFTLETWNISEAENIVDAMDKNDGDNLPEGFPGNLPEDPVILADITKRISREIDGKIGPDGLAVTEARRDRNLVEEWEEADPAIDSQPPVVPLFLVLYALFMLGLAGYALASGYLP
ncbi:hypothetical protein [Mesorhizobium sp.]|uniref:hypothetical protein n=4 Tax=Mesorhizobium sp. TaxID=1871066 RepID=UPI00120CC682|nr:hypothetical protein [Mesorhizobium sp.]TIL43672.1 MAG: hypothetical protein E5Y86_20915 [Mesorhizobium sp.]